MSKQAESEALHLRARAFVAAFERDDEMPEAFDALAKDIADFQARNITGYARLRAARKEEIPAVPTDAFKVTRVSVFAEAETPFVFRTSGTTVGARGSHWFRTCETYDLGAVAFGRDVLGVADRTEVLVVGPTPLEQPDSSLGFMLDLFARHLGGGRHFVRAGADAAIDVAGLAHATAEAREADEPAIVLGTSFALVHLLEARAESYGKLIVTEMGKPLGEAVGEVKKSAFGARHFAGEGAA